MKFIPGPETRAAVLRHPFVLAGLAVVVLLGITAGALVVVDSARGGTEAPRVIIEQETVTPGPVVKTAEATGVHGSANRTAAVRSAPGATTPLLGTIPIKSDVAIDGRTTDSKWYRVIFPPRSELHGWIEAASLDVTGDPSTLVVATAEPPVVVEVPTTPRRVNTPHVVEPATAAPDTPTAAPALADLVVGTTPTITGGKLFVTIVNQGTGAARGDLVVAVFNADGSQLVGGATIPGFTLEAGRSIDVGTGIAVAGSQTLLIIVDPNGDITETDDTNNRALIAVADEPPTPPPAADTPTPEAPPPPP
jgi:uncharacterized protein YraI